MFNFQSTADAALVGDLTEIINMLNHGHEWHEKTTSCAGFNGHLHVLKFAHEHNFIFHPLTLVECAHHGHLQCIQFLHEVVKFSWNSLCFDFASKYGYAQILQYAYEHGCTFEVVVFDTAARYGHYDCLRVLFNTTSIHDIKSNTSITQNAWQGGHDECLRYAISRGCSIHPCALPRWNDIQATIQAVYQIVVTCLEHTLVNDILLFVLQPYL